MIQKTQKYKLKNAFLVLFFWMFFGLFGGHNFYLERYKCAFLQLALGCLAFFVIDQPNAWRAVIAFWWLVDIYFMTDLFRAKNDLIRAKAASEGVDVDSNPISPPPAAAGRKSTAQAVFGGIWGLFFIGVFLLMWGSVDYNKKQAERRRVAQSASYEVKNDEGAGSGSGFYQRQQSIIVDPLFEKASAGDVSAEVELGEELFWGEEGRTKNEMAAFYWWNKGALAGDAKAQYLTGLCELQGVGTQVNIAAGRQWIATAAGNGNSDALYALGLLNIEEKMDRKTTIFYMEKSAAAGNKDAIVWLKNNPH
jgi:hypothetical protein